MSYPQCIHPAILEALQIEPQYRDERHWIDDQGRPWYNSRRMGEIRVRPHIDRIDTMAFADHGERYIEGDVSAHCLLGNQNVFQMTINKSEVTNELVPITRDIRKQLLILGWPTEVDIQTY